MGGGTQDRLVTVIATEAAFMRFRLKRLHGEGLLRKRTARGSPGPSLAERNALYGTMSPCAIKVAAGISTTPSVPEITSVAPSHASPVTVPGRPAQKGNR